MSDEEESGLAAGCGALGRVLLLGTEAFVAFGGRTGRTFVKLGVRVTQLDRDVTETLLIVTHSL